MDPLRFPARVARHLAWRARRTVAVTLDALRRGDRTVIMTPPAGLRFGNWLYLWLDAHARTRAGEVTLVLKAPGMEPWLELLPSLRELTIARENLRFHDRREWDENSWNQRFDEDFTRAQLQDFIRDVIAPYVTPDRSGALVVNIRRGDYYENPGLRRLYGFDQIGYLAEALRRVEPAERVLVVSDDPDWCRDNLDALLRETGATVDYASRDPGSNFLAVASSRQLIGTNSTFSYWGGYIAGVLHADPVIVMPRFHARLGGTTDAYQLDPEWSAVDGFH